ncbi:hypothetical protein P7C70_g7224, partial [Phenoliferia sp. Uapishka_3]
MEDYDLISLFASLQLNDLEAIANARKGKGYIGARNDEEIALELYRRELEDLHQISRDHALALSQENALRTDSEILQTLSETEATASSDRQAAVNLSRGIPLPRLPELVSRPPPLSPSASTSAAPANSKVAATATATRSSSSITLLPPPPYTPFNLAEPRHLSDLHEHPRPPTSSSTATSSGATRFGGERAECVICTDNVPLNLAVKVPCGHHYCHSCLKDLFLAATIDERLMPPSCDRQFIPVALAHPLLTVEQVKLFKDKQVEFSTTNRLYCYKPTCSRFLGAASSTEKAPVTCGDCSSTTCKACKGPWHGLFSACAADTDEEAFAALDKELGCQRCPGCKRIVQLDTGCFHM